MNRLKKFLIGLALAAGLVGPAVAATPAYFMPPQPSPGTARALEWIAGQIEVRRSSTDHTTVIVLSSTGNGIWTMYGIQANTMTVVGLAEMSSTTYNSWVTFFSSVSAQGFFSGSSGTFGGWLQVSSQVITFGLSAGSATFTLRPIVGSTPVVTTYDLQITTTIYGTVGVINTPTNPLEWTQLKNVPAGFADGVDASAAGAGGGMNWQNLVNNSTIPTTAGGSSGTISQGMIAYQDSQTSSTLKSWNNVQLATGAMNIFPFHESATGTAIGPWKTYDTIFPTRSAVVGQTVLVYSSGGINNGWGLFFNGTAFSTISIQGANLGDSYGGTTGKFSIEGWIRGPASGGNLDFIERNPGGKGYYLRWNSSQALDFTLYDGAGVSVSGFTSSATMNANSWNHFVCTYDGAKASNSKSTCFINGNVCSGNSTDSGGSVTINQGVLNIGAADGGARAFTGFIGFIATYDWALDQAAAARQFKAGVVRLP